MIIYKGNDGSSIKRAIKIIATSEWDGVDAEYNYLGKLFPGYTVQVQFLIEDSGHYYDLLVLINSTGKKTEVWFDITAFFGKPMWTKEELNYGSNSAFI
jgi:hypothetical protein